MLVDIPSGLPEVIAAALEALGPQRGQQVRAVVGGQPGVAGAQAADRRLGCGERRAQVMANRREQRRPLPVGLGHPGSLPGQAAQQDQPPRSGLGRHDPAPSWRAGSAAASGP